MEPQADRRVVRQDAGLRPADRGRGDRRRVPHHPRSARLHEQAHHLHRRAGADGAQEVLCHLPYSKVQFFTIQTPGFAELVSDSELYLMFSNGFTAKFEFRGSVDIGALGRTISTYVL